MKNKNDISLRINELVLKFSDGNNSDFARKTNTSEANIRNYIKGKSSNADFLMRITEIFEINCEWLLTGRGDMLNSDKSNIESLPTINYNNKGVPYYDVDFIGGYNIIENDQTINPTYHIDFPQYNKADSWVNITGHSMEPLINHGDMIALKKIEDWKTYILYGEIYAIVTDEYRTVKKVRKSTKGDNYLKLVPLNGDYDEQDIDKRIIRSVFQVMGCAKKIF